MSSKKPKQSERVEEKDSDGDTDSNDSTASMKDDRPDDEIDKDTYRRGRDAKPHASAKRKESPGANTARVMFGAGGEDEDDEIDFDDPNPILRAKISALIITASDLPALLKQVQAERHSTKHEKTKIEIARLSSLKTDPAPRLASYNKAMTVLNSNLESQINQAKDLLEDAAKKLKRYRALVWKKYCAEHASAAKYDVLKVVDKTAMMNEKAAIYLRDAELELEAKREEINGLSTAIGAAEARREHEKVKKLMNKRATAKQHESSLLMKVETLKAKLPERKKQREEDERKKQREEDERKKQSEEDERKKQSEEDERKKQKAQRNSRKPKPAPAPNFSNPLRQSQVFHQEKPNILDFKEDEMLTFLRIEPSPDWKDVDACSGGLLQHCIENATGVDTMFRDVRAAVSMDDLTKKFKAMELVDLPIANMPPIQKAMVRFFAMWKLAQKHDDVYHVMNGINENGIAALYARVAAMFQVDQLADRFANASVQPPNDAMHQ